LDSEHLSNLHWWTEIEAETNGFAATAVSILCAMSGSG
jgi:hypothetical protein